MTSPARAAARLARPALAIVAAALAACGPSQTQIRKAVNTSSHRTLAVLPFDYRGGERNAAPSAGDGFESRLRVDGFSIYDRGKTRKLYQSSLDAKTGAFDAIARTAELGRALGVSAVVVGSSDDAFERAENVPASFRFDPVPPPSCCYDPRNPCAHRPVYDPEVDHYVDSCNGTHRRVRVSAGYNGRYSGVTVRVRFVDTKSATVIWETRYSAALHQTSLGQVVDQAMDVVHDQLAAALLDRKL